MTRVYRSLVIKLKELILYGCHQFFVRTSPQVCPAYAPPEKGIACEYYTLREIKADTARGMSRRMDYTALKAPLAYLHSIFKALVYFYNFLSSYAKKRCLCRNLFIQENISSMQEYSCPRCLFQSLNPAYMVYMAVCEQYFSRMQGILLKNF